MKCGHDDCRCTVGGGERFCGEHCRDRANAEDSGHACMCGHPACEDAGTRETEQDIQEAFE